MNRKLVFAVIAIVCLAAMLISGTLSVVVDDDKPPFMVVRGVDSGIYYRLFDEATSAWGEWVKLPGGTSDSPGAAYVGDELCVVVRGLDGWSLWQGFIDVATGTFSGWTFASGATLAAPELGSATGGTSNIMESQIYETIYASWTGSLDGWNTIASLTTPSLPTGYFKVELDAHSYLEYPSRLAIGIGVDSAASDATTTRYWQCDSSPFVNGSTLLTGVHTQEVFLLSEGTHTFYFRAGETSGGEHGYCGLQNSHITVTFFPYVP